MVDINSIRDSFLIKTAKQRILMNTPHLITAASNNTADVTTLVHFKTDLASPLKECKINFNPVQQGSDEPSITNIKTIHGWNAIDVTRCGKNLLQVINDSGERSGVDITINRNSNGEMTSIYLNGSTTRDNWFWNMNYVADTHKTLMGTFTLSTGYPKTALILSRVDSGSIRTDIAVDSCQEYTKTYTYSDTLDNPNDISSWYRLEMWPRNTATKTIDADVYPMIRVPGDDSTFEPYNGQTTTIQLPDTFYKGYIDLISGELVQTHMYYERAIADMNNAEKWPGWRSTGLAEYTQTSGEDIIIGEKTNISSAFCLNAMSSTGHLYFLPEQINSLTQSELKANYGDIVVQFIVPLGTPIHHFLNPITIKTLKGINNIWSNSNGPMEIKYWTH